MRNSIEEAVVEGLSLLLDGNGLDVLEDSGREMKVDGTLEDAVLGRGGVEKLPEAIAVKSK